MTLTAAGPCQVWASDDDLPDECDTLTDAVSLQMCEVASELLYEATGRVFSGGCTTTVRPCAQWSASDVTGDIRRAYEGGMWSTWGTLSNLWGGYCSCNRDDSCGCTRLSVVRINSTLPVASVTTVRVDGVPLDSSRYRVDNKRWLVRLADADGTNPGWPCCQDLELADTADDTFSVTYVAGHAPPNAGKLAAAVLACELGKAYTGGTCKLPKNVAAVSRQGVSIQIAQQLGSGQIVTGIHAIDYFLGVYGQRGGAGGVLIPGRGPDVRRTSTT